MSLQKFTRINLRFGALSGPQFTLLLYVGQWLFWESRRFCKKFIVNYLIEPAGKPSLLQEGLRKFLRQGGIDRFQDLIFVKHSLLITQRHVGNREVEVRLTVIRL